MYDDSKIIGKVNKKVRNATKRYMEKYNLNLADAFKEACRYYASKSTELYIAWYYDDFRKFIPSEYNKKYLDFEKYPLKYKW